MASGAHSAVGCFSLQNGVVEVYSSKYWERNQTTLYFMISKGPGRAAHSPVTHCFSSLAVMPHVLMCSRHSGKLTAPPSLCYFSENLSLVDSASYCSTHNNPAKPQLAVISLEYLFNNVKVLLTIYKWSLSPQDVSYHWWEKLINFSNCRVRPQIWERLNTCEGVSTAPADHRILHNPDAVRGLHTAWFQLYLCQEETNPVFSAGNCSDTWEEE